jgi:hypothetical protein
MLREVPPVGAVRKRSIKAIPVRDLSQIRVPPRQFAIGLRYQFGTVSVGASPGGVGKTTLSTMEAIGWVIGQSLTGEYMRARGNAWVISAEESQEELERRVSAICRFYRIDPADLCGKLFLTSTQENNLFKVLRVGERGNLVETQDPDDVIAEMQENNIGYVSVDPFVTTHEGDESDNGVMDRATRIFCRIASTTHAVVSLFHHVVKSDDPEAHAGNLARVRGAGGITNAARHAFTIANINQDTKAKYGLTDEEAVRIMRMDTGLKSNYVMTPTQPMWFWRESIDLDNAIYNDDGSLVWPADSVGVLRPFRMEDLTEERRRIEDAKLEPERDKTAQVIANIMTADRMGMSAFVKAVLKTDTFGKCADTRLREIIRDAVPEAPRHRAVNIGGERGRIYLCRVGQHAHAGVEIVRQVDP